MGSPRMRLGTEGLFMVLTHHRDHHKHAAPESLRDPKEGSCSMGSLFVTGLAKKEDSDPAYSCRILNFGFGSQFLPRWRRAVTSSSVSSMTWDPLANTSG